MLHIWKSIQKKIEKTYLPHDLIQNGGIEYWRAKLFLNVSITILLVGMLAYLPGVIMSIVTDLYIIAFIDTFVLIVYIFVFFHKKLSLEVKKNIFIIGLYILALFLLLFLGAMGPGLIWLLAVSAFMVLIKSSKWGFISILLNSLVYGSLALLLFVGNVQLPVFNHYNAGTWLAVGANLLVLNAVLVNSISILVGGLQKKIEKELELHRILLIEKEDLRLSKIKAEESDKLKSAFLANTSHEIRTPLNGIIGFAEILAEGDVTNENRIQFSKLISESGEQLLRIVNDIIDISKIEAGQMTVNMKSFMLNELIDSIYLIYKNLTNAKGIELRCTKLLSDEMSYIMTDKTKLRQILENLLNNAIKFTHEGFVELGYTVENNFLQFYVRDSGIGIPENMVDDVFTRFRQVESGLSRNYGGTGLGLAIAKAYTELLGGSIGVVSKQWEGSIFYFSIRYNQTVEVQSSKLNEKIPEIKKGLNILIVEDEHINIVFLQECLSYIEAKTHVCKKGREAIEYAQNNTTTELILMDIRLPDINGYEVTKQIKKIKPSIPIIVQTAYAMADDKQKAQEAGCDAYIAKPVNKKVLLDTIALLTQKNIKKDNV